MSAHREERDGAFVSGALTLDGTLRDHKVALQLERFDEKKFLLESRGFHWVQDYPFNR